MFSLIRLMWRRSPTNVHRECYGILDTGNPLVVVIETASIVSAIEMGREGGIIGWIDWNRQCIDVFALLRILLVFPLATPAWDQSPANAYCECNGILETRSPLVIVIKTAKHSAHYWESCVTNASILDDYWSIEAMFCPSRFSDRLELIAKCENLVIE